jgi:hypothetical protein
LERAFRKPVRVTPTHLLLGLEIVRDCKDAMSFERVAGSSLLTTHVDTTAVTVV